MDSMKDLIIKLIQTDGNLNRTLKVLLTNDGAAITQRYEEECLRKTGKKDAKDDEMLRYVLSFESRHLKTALQAWVKDDVWLFVKQQTGKAPDAIEFAVSLHEALDQLRLGRALSGADFDRTRNVRPMPLPAGPRTRAVKRTLALSEGSASA